MARQTIPKILKVAVQMSWEWILLTGTNIASEHEFKGHNIFTFLEMNILKILNIYYLCQSASRKFPNSYFLSKWKILQVSKNLIILYPPFPYDQSSQHDKKDVMHV